MIQKESLDEAIFSFKEETNAISLLILGDNSRNLCPCFEKMTNEILNILHSDSSEENKITCIKKWHKAFVCLQSQIELLQTGAIKNDKQLHYYKKFLHDRKTNPPDLYKAKGFSLCSYEGIEYARKKIVHRNPSNKVMTFNMMIFVFVLDNFF